MKAHVDKDLCIGCGLCPTVAPDIYDMDEDGKAKVIIDDIPSDKEGEAKEGAESCPVGAIAVE